MLDPSSGKLLGKKDIPLWIAPADLGFSRSPTWVGDAIRWCSRGRYEPPTYTNHTFGIGTQNAVVEALWKVTVTPVLEWKLPKEFELYRNMTLHNTKRLAIALWAEEQEGDVYGAAKIGLHLGDALLTKIFARNIFLFRRIAFLEDYPICSWLWAWAYSQHGIRTSVCAPRYASPDDQHDWVKGRGSGDWALIMKRFPDGRVIGWDEFTGYPVSTRSGTGTETASSSSAARLAPRRFVRLAST